jgi:hypothetical protein
MNDENKHLKLHKALSEAEVEYQKKFDVVKNFEKELLSSVVNIPQTLEDWNTLKKEEKAAYDKREAAREAYKEFLRINFP